MTKPSNSAPTRKNVSDKAKKIMNKYASICGLKWGVGYKEMRTIYRGAFVPIISYAAHVWLYYTNSKSRQSIISAHRCALIRVNKSYRTTSTAALEVLAGIQPTINELYIEKLRYSIRRNLICIINGTNYSTTPQDAKASIIQLRENLAEKWQEDWQNSQWGRKTFDFFPNIKDRLSKTWVVPSYYITQIYTGHGNFNNYPAKIQKTDSDLCICGEPESVIHNIYYCRNHTRQREIFIRKIIPKGYIWPIRSTDLTNRDIYDDFTVFITQLMKDKESSDNQ